MTVAFADRCRQTSTTKGTGPFVLSAPEASWFALSSSYAVDADIPIVLVGRTSAGAATGEVVVGRGHLNGAGALVVDVVERSSAGGAPVSFSADVVEVFATATKSALAAALQAVVDGVAAWARPGTTALASDTIVVDFSGTRLQTRSAAGAVVLDGTGYLADRETLVVIVNGTTSAVPVAEIAGWTWMSESPVSIRAGGRLRLRLNCTGEDAASVLASADVEDPLIDLSPRSTMVALVDANAIPGVNGSLVTSVRSHGTVPFAFASVRRTTQPTLASKPNSEIVFDGVNDFLASTVWPGSFLDPLTGDFTIYAVVRSLTAHQRVLFGTQSSGIAGWHLAREANGAIRFRISNSGSFVTDVVSAAGVLTLNDYHLITVVMGTTSVTVRVDGVEVIAAAAAVTTAISANRQMCLAADGGGGSQCHLALSVFALFAGAHSLVEVAANEATLTMRYGAFPVAP